MKENGPVHIDQMDVRGQSYSATGTRTRVARVRAEYPNQLDYSGVVNKIENHTINIRWVMCLRARRENAREIIAELRTRYNRSYDAGVSYGLHKQILCTLKLILNGLVV